MKTPNKPEMNDLRGKNFRLCPLILSSTPEW